MQNFKVSEKQPGEENRKRRRIHGNLHADICRGNGMNMSGKSKTSDSEILLRTLAGFRFELRQFLHFSELAAIEAGLQPQQHQLLLQVAGAPEGVAVTIAFAAERLSLRHHSVVELVNRSEREGLLVRSVDAGDRRRAILRVTPKGERILDQLVDDHARELKEHAPRLAKALKRIEKYERDSADANAHGSNVASNS
jgi:DNA-binding MarR family transcriptional regulator